MILRNLIYNNRYNRKKKRLSTEKLEQVTFFKEKIFFYTKNASISVILFRCPLSFSHSLSLLKLNEYGSKRSHTEKYD
jgi:hypothetical protein